MGTIVQLVLRSREVDALSSLLHALATKTDQCEAKWNKKN